MGRHRKPIEQHKRDGTYQPCRHAGPEPEVIVPEMPTGLGEDAKRYWPEIAQVIKETGVYTKADRFALRLLCDSYADYAKARDVLENEGRYIERVTKNGVALVDHPALKAMGRHWKEVAYMLRKFGMTPSDRTGLHVGDKDDKKQSDLEILLGGGRLN